MKEQVDEISVPLKNEKATFTRFRLEFIEVPDQLLDSMLKYNAQIIHFCGLGSENTDETEHLPEPLSMIFQTLGNDIRCVLMIGCHSDVQAKALAQFVDCVVGLPRGISPKAAIDVATSFYLALATEKNIDVAVRSSKVKLVISHHLPEDSITLVTREGKNPSEISFPIKKVITSMSDLSKSGVYVVAKLDKSSLGNPGGM